MLPADPQGQAQREAKFISLPATAPAISHKLSALGTWDRTPECLPTSFPVHSQLLQD